jgi:hypothetical protein
MVLRLELLEVSRSNTKMRSHCRPAFSIGAPFEPLALGFAAF